MILSRTARPRRLAAYAWSCPVIADCPGSDFLSTGISFRVCWADISLMNGNLELLLVPEQLVYAMFHFHLAHQAIAITFGFMSSHPDHLRFAGALVLARTRGKPGAISTARRGPRGCPGFAGANRAVVGSCHGGRPDERRPAAANLEEVGMSLVLLETPRAQVASAIENRVWSAARIPLPT